MHGKKKDYIFNMSYMYIFPKKHFLALVTKNWNPDLAPAQNTKIEVHKIDQFSWGPTSWKKMHYDRRRRGRVREGGYSTIAWGGAGASGGSPTKFWGMYIFSAIYCITYRIVGYLKSFVGLAPLWNSFNPFLWIRKISPAFIQSIPANTKMNRI